MKRTVLLFIVSVALASINSCTDFQEEAPPDKMSVNGNEMAFSVDGNARQLTIRSGSVWYVASKPQWLSVLSINKSSSIFEWDVAFSARANDEYDREGVVLFKSESETVDVKVTQEGNKGKYIAVQSVSFSTNELTLTEGENAQLSYSITPSNASIKDVTWKSSSTSVARVSSSGNVNAISAGTATITATTEDGNKTATCVVTVKPKVISVTSVSLDYSSLTLTEGDSQTLTATVSPSNATDKSVTWSSSNTSVAIVSSTGVVTSKTAGTATITVRTSDGGKTATCSVTVQSTTGIENGHEWVDLGLSVKWSPLNHGASSVTDYGGYYFWGDPTGTASVDYYSAPMTYHISGTAYDIAKQKWGGDWRLPTFSEVKELYTRCSWSWTTVNGKTVLKAIGPNGKSIEFVPTGLMYGDTFQASDSVIILSGDSFNSTSFASYVTIYPYFYKISPDGEATEAGHSGSYCRFPIRPVR